MCLYNYRLYKTNSKFISPYHQQKLLTSFKCGKCPECLEQTRREWYARTLYEHMDTVNSGGYTLFDCLTYAPEHLPRVSDFFPSAAGMWYDKPCFNHSHLTNFMKRLRVSLERAGYASKDNLRFYAATEYGEHNTKRSHIHICLFVRNNFIEPLELSKFVSDNWSFGRTDGVPYKSSYYVENHNVVRGNKGSSSRVCKYVAKYVTKSIDYQSRLNGVVEAILRNEYDYLVRDVPSVVLDFGSGIIDSVKFKSDYSDFEQFVSSPLGKKIRASIRRPLDMYHRQSQGFGLFALNGRTADDFIKDPSIYVFDDDKVAFRIFLPLYFRRKLFQRLFVYNGAKFWEYTEKGKEFANALKMKVFEFQCKRLREVIANTRIQFDVPRLARYLVYHRGCSDGDLCNIFVPSDVLKLSHILFNYNSSSDLAHYHFSFLSHKWLGSSQTSYSLPNICYPLDLYISEHVQIDSELEGLIWKIEVAQNHIKQGLTDSYSLSERLESLYSELFK